MPPLRFVTLCVIPSMHLVPNRPFGPHPHLPSPLLPSLPFPTQTSHKITLLSLSSLPLHTYHPLHSPKPTIPFLSTSNSSFLPFPTQTSPKITLLSTSNSSPPKTPRLPPLLSLLPRPTGSGWRIKGNFYQLEGVESKKWLALQSHHLHL